MYDLTERRRALALVSQGHSLNAVSRMTGVSRSALREWRVRVEPKRSVPDCPGRASGPAYAYLLGLYLGDGCISPQPRGGHTLRIACSDAWPGLIDACEEAVRAVCPGNSVCRVHAQGCTMVTSYGRHWPCLFPQHGPGRKHERPIALEPWQQAVVDEHPWDFVRGLIHSDGSRVVNRTTRLVGGEPRRYEYPRYFFTNKSVDIRRLYTDTLDTLGVAWRQANACNVSVARKASVALMDRFVGPKY
ncbi:helix-turn-helix domain-containing protein [Streptomyces sp. MI02-7b]|uniref:helix-turn-helix domain-containing protein n=1 Tax=Streptomyces sp. MI02-7b TaxID=462941 RepID=UPI0029B19AC2|nr:helix-turn-helix domain-containing protein [Streptomyces sp. MI02-7b]MDX3074341.1 helix-turn-helix domain-containing protein [Streptomyces sp. MI02-7b]